MELKALKLEIFIISILLSAGEVDKDSKMSTHIRGRKSFLYRPLSPYDSEFMLRAIATKIIPC